MEKRNILNETVTGTFPSQALGNTSGARVMSEQECKARLPKGFSWVDCSDIAFREAFTEIWNPESSIVLISGQGGSGKSILAQIAYHKDPQHTMVLGSTGIAAQNLFNSSFIPAETIHVGLGLGRCDLFDQPYEESAALTLLQRKIVNRIKNNGINTILIDEVSMVSANLMDEILWMIEKCQRNIKLILFGDPCQLQPVMKEDVKKELSEKYPDLWKKAFGDGICFFYSRRLKAAPNYKKIALTRIMRQGGNQATFKTILAKARLGKTAQDDLDFLNYNCCQPLDQYEAKYGDNYLCLTGTNKEVNLINASRIAKLKNPIRTYHAFYSLPDGDDRPLSSRDIEKQYGKAFRKEYPQYFHEHENGWSADVRLGVGMKVMVTANIPYQDVANGTIGKIEKIVENDSVGQHGLPTVYVSHEGPGGKMMTAEINPICLGLSSRLVKVGLSDWNDACAYVSVLPLTPAYAITFHKAQGLTLDRVYIYTNTSFVSDGAMYVALSRCKTLEGIGLSDYLTLDKVQPDARSKAWYEETFGQVG